MARHRDSPAVMVCGGAGAGKTSALLAWAHDQASAGAAVAWVTLDLELAQREAFWTLVLHHVAAKGLPVDAELSNALEQQAGSMRHALPALLLRQFAPSNPPTTLVVDRGDLAAGGPLVDDLERLAEQRTSLRVVFSSRKPPGTSEAERRMGDRLAVCPPSLLAFDRSEIAALAAAGGWRLPAARLDTVHAVTGGWPLAVRAELAGEGAAEATMKPGTVTRRLGARLVDELRSEPEFETLLALSLAGAIDERLARDLGVTPAALQLLEHCAVRGLGTGAVGDERGLRLQPVVRAALRRECLASRPDLARRTLAVLSSTMEARGMLLAAISAAVAAEDWPRVARLGCRRLSEAAVRVPGYSAIVQRIPQAAQRANPLLRFLVAHDDFAGGLRAQALRRFERFLADAAGRARAGSAATAEDAWIQCFVTLTLRLLGRHVEAAESATRLMAILESVDDVDGELEAATSMLLSQAAVSHLQIGRSARALTVLDEAGFDVLPSRPVIERARILAMRALVTSERGELAMTRSLLERLNDQPFPPGFVTGCTTVPATIAAARLDLELGAAERAERRIAQVESVWRTSEFWPLMLECVVRARWLRHGPRNALLLLEAQLEEGHARPGLSPSAASMLLSLRVDLLLAQHRATEARRELAGEVEPASARVAVARSRIALLTGEAKKAAFIAAGALQRASTPMEEMALSALSAAASLRAGDDDRLIDQAWSRAVAIARREGLLSPFVLLPKSTLDTLLSDEPELRNRLAPWSSQLAESAEAVDLTPRERLMLECLMLGRTLAETAQHLFVTVNTVKSQRQSLYRKLGVGSRDEAIDQARRLHLI